MSHGFETSHIADGGRRADPQQAFTDLSLAFIKVLDLQVSSDAILKNFVAIIRSAAEAISKRPFPKDVSDYTVPHSAAHVTTFKTPHQKFYAYAGLVVYAFQRMLNFMDGDKTPAIDAFVHQLHGVLSQHGIQPESSSDPFYSGNPVYLKAFCDSGLHAAVQDVEKDAEKGLPRGSAARMTLGFINTVRFSDTATSLGRTASRWGLALESFTGFSAYNSFVRKRP